MRSGSPDNPNKWKTQVGGKMKECNCNKWKDFNFDLEGIPPDWNNCPWCGAELVDAFKAGREVNK